MKQIPLTQGRSATVDDDDYEWLSLHKWRFNFGYAVRSGKREPRKNQKTIRMAREIMRPAIGLQIDHINRNTLDNRKSNLRIVTPTQNRWNVGANRQNKTGIRGVTIHSKGKFQATICFQRRSYYLGLFTDTTSAAEAYRKAAIELRGGEFAC